MKKKKKKIPQGQRHSALSFHHFGQSTACTLRQRHLKCHLAKRRPHGQFCKVKSLHVSPFFEEWWNGRHELWQQFASLQRFLDRVASAEGLCRTGWHSSRMEQMMMRHHFGLTDVCLWQSECQSLSVTRRVILLQECNAICFFFMQCLITRL